MQNRSYEKLLQYALRIISKKRYTTAGMKEKLEQFFNKRKLEGKGDEVIGRVMGRLNELKYLDDAQYALDYINERIKFRPRGKLLLSRELHKRGIARDLFEKVFGGIDFDEDAVATDALERSMRKWRNDELRKQREKAYRYLASRGFKPDAIYKALNRCYNQIS